MGGVRPHWGQTPKRKGPYASVRGACARAEIIGPLRRHPFKWALSVVGSFHFRQCADNAARPRRDVGVFLREWRCTWMRLQRCAREAPPSGASVVRRIVVLPAMQADEPVLRGPLLSQSTAATRGTPATE